MAQLFKNNARATLGGSGLSSTVVADGTFSVATGKGALFPGIDPVVAGTFFDVTIQDATNIEIIRIKKRASDVFTIDSRAREGTTASTFASGAIVSLRLTAAVIESTLSHPATTTGAHAASAISNAPAGNIAATTVQAAIDELDTEKEAVGTASSTMSTHTGAADPHPQYALDTDLATKQNADPQLDTLAAITAQQATDLASLSPFVGTLLNDADAATFRASIGANAGTVTNVTGTAPIAVANGSTTPDISIPAATASAAGHMTAAYASKLDGIQAGANYFVGVSNDVGANAVGSFQTLFSIAGWTVGGTYAIAPGTWRCLSNTDTGLVNTGGTTVYCAHFQRIA